MRYTAVSPFQGHLALTHGALTLSLGTSYRPGIAEIGPFELPWPFLRLWSQCRSAPHHSLSRIPREGNALLENLSFWCRLWPIASVAAAVLVNAIWIGALAYGLARLL